MYWILFQSHWTWGLRGGLVGFFGFVLCRVFGFVLLFLIGHCLSSFAFWRDKSYYGLHTFISKQFVSVIKCPLLVNVFLKQYENVLYKSWEFSWVLVIFCSSLITKMTLEHCVVCRRCAVVICEAYCQMCTGGIWHIVPWVNVYDLTNYLWQLQQLLFRYTVLSQQFTQSRFQ